MTSVSDLIGVIKEDVGVRGGLVVRWDLGRVRGELEGEFVPKIDSDSVLFDRLYDFGHHVSVMVVKQGDLFIIMCVKSVY